ncbi:hypothetical protein DXG03_008922 [Asterophora parasitica]|uniref:Exocyst complex component Sec8 n=1 Tax=Asterophora parasitica TaxID=117018 RepID=A0A9P7GDF8_9AGAR|nr:hypothetical protein DXG03_008922 [Asterophora parasitica]
MEYQTERQNEVEAEKARQQRIRDKVPGRRANGKARAGDIDAVLDQVKDGWEFIIDPDFNSVDLALQLLDDSSHGKDMDSFRRTKDMLGKALKGSVDKHYQAFAASLPHQAALLGHLSETQTQISVARSSLLEAKEALGNKRADLVQLWSRGQTLEEMLRILDQIEHLKSVPDLLETLMSEKRLLQAAVLLVRSLKIINKPDMLEIGAVSDLRGYLVGQETALRDILIDELQNHLYLKSFWCDTRWAAYVPNQQAFPKVEFEEEGASTTFEPSESTPTSPSFRPSRQARFLNELAIKPNEPPIDLSDLSVSNGGQPSTSNLTSMSSTSPHNPEADSFAYMETLIESLAVLSKLGSALDNVTQRLPNEIFGLVETTLGEVEERAEYGRRGSTFDFNAAIGRTEGVYILASENPAVGPMALSKGSFLKSTSLRLAALESSTKRVDHEILKDLFWTLYSKLDAVGQGLRVVYEVANRVGSRRDFRDSTGTKPGSLFPLSEVWTPIQTEVRTLIHDYLTDEDQGSVSGRNPISSINEILREGKFTRDRGKAVFRFADTDMKLTSKALKPHEDGLTRVLNDTMPGLVPGSGDAVQATLASVGTDDRMLGADQHHRLIIHPDAFHVSVLFQPTLTFLSRIAEVLPFGIESERTSSAVLDEFVLKVYLPQLEEKISENRRFQALLKTYEQLSGLILDSIRIDVRCRTIFYLDSATRQGDYSIGSEASEPDPHIVDLNAELVKCDDFVSTCLPARERQFVFVGLGHLLEDLLISNARHLRLPTSFGIKKIMRNILALQQSIKALTNDQQSTEFERAKQYYSLFFLSPQVMLHGIRKKPVFTFDEYQTMLNLQCGVNPAEGEEGAAKAVDRNYGMYMIELHGLELESSGP